MTEAVVLKPIRTRASTNMAMSWLAPCSTAATMVSADDQNRPTRRP